MRVLGLVPARGGSRGIPHKNVRPLGGRPLIAWTATAALAARTLGRLVVSTDDPEIAAVARGCGLEVPFMRPAELARDDTPTLPVVQHALRALEAAGDTFDAVCLLQPTSPFRAPRDIDACVTLLDRSGADAVVTVLRVPTEHHPHWVYLAESDGRLRLTTGDAQPTSRRQLLPPAFHREGSVYVTRRDVVMHGGSLYGRHLLGHEVDGALSVNVDGPADWARAEALLERGAA